MTKKSPFKRQAGRETARLKTEPLQRLTMPPEGSRIRDSMSPAQRISTDRKIAACASVEGSSIRTIEVQTQAIIR